MTDKNIINALRRNMVETGSLVCTGCGHEHNCGTHGCAVMRAAADRLEELTASQWTNVKDGLPDEGIFVLTIVNGNPQKNITLLDSYQIATYYSDGCWVVEEYPDWETPDVSYWMPLPSQPRGV